jgi:hypothetical protein
LFVCFFQGRVICEDAEESEQRLSVKELKRDLQKKLSYSTDKKAVSGLQDVGV